MEMAAFRVFTGVKYHVHMLRRARSYKTVKYKKPKSLRSNISVHPFVVIAITAALVLVVLVAVAWRFWAK